MDSVKRKRLENYEDKDTALILRLVEKYDVELQSLNVSEKHKTWMKIEDEFNIQKVGISRDLLCLKNKWKNLKARNRKDSIKIDSKKNSDYQDSENSGNEDSKSLTTPEKKRSSNFNDHDTNLLIKLIIKNGLNKDEVRVATSKVAVEAKNKSWIKLLNAFNILKTGGSRTINELKIKYKNLKQKDLALFSKYKDEFNDDPLDDEDEQKEDEDSVDKEFTTKTKSPNSPTKRGEKFNEHDSKLFIQLLKKYSKVLKSKEITKAAISAKKKTWASFEEDYNSNCKGVHRTIDALKNKSKNLRANTRKSDNETMCIDSDTEDEEINSIEYEESEFLNEEDLSDDNTIIIEEILPEITTKYAIPSIQEINILPANNTSQVIYSDDLKEIHRENLMLKNEVLKKKKRLLELEIAIAEKKLRGQ